VAERESTVEGVGVIRAHFAGVPVLVTGHTGFKGSWLSLWLHRLGAKVSGFALAPPTDPSNFVVSGVQNLLAHHIEADVRDRGAVRAAITKVQPRVVFHMAAQPLVRESYREPLETFGTNVMGTATVLDAVRERGAPCVVIVVTSDKCYENQEHVWGYREIDPMGGHDPYSASKGAAELVTSAYRKSFFPVASLEQHGIAVASARAGNVIGGGDWAKDRLMVDAILALQQNVAVQIRNPTAVRPWQHVLEPLSGYLLLAARMLERRDPSICSAWNFGPVAGDCLPVQSIVEQACRAWGDGRWDARVSSAAPHEAGMLRLNIDKAQSFLQWQPRWRVHEAVQRTVAWYRAFYAAPQTSMASRCLADIAAYEEAASPA
jgi:CDP-glucose 4,6-dehydratase